MQDWLRGEYLDASMGPRLLDRGELPDGGSPSARSPASMGPRLLDRGEVATEHNPRRELVCFNGAAVVRPRRVEAQAELFWSAGRASMGPRLLDRGEEESEEEESFEWYVLQWGRGC